MAFVVYCFISKYFCNYFLVHFKYLNPVDDDKVNVTPSGIKKRSITKIIFIYICSKCI